MTSLCKKIEWWLKQPQHSKARLAYEMGYETSSAIDMWLRRRRIPRHKHAQLKRILGGK